MKMRPKFHDIWADDFAIDSFPTLQLQCLYYLAGRLEVYSPQTLALLPVALRRRLLLHLPIRDVCQLEGDAVFMNGIDPDSVWHDLLNQRISSLAMDPRLWALLERQPSAKDAYLAEVSLFLLTRERRYKYKFPGYDNEEVRSKVKLGFIKYLLFGIRLACEDVLLMTSFMKHSSFGFTWLLPSRYEREIGDDWSLSIVETFLSQFQWYPRRLDLTERDKLDEGFTYGNSIIFQNFMSRIETINVENDDYRDEMQGELLIPLWHAVARSKPSSLASVTFSACVTNLYYLYGCMIDTVFTGAEEQASQIDHDKDTSSLESEVDLDPEFDYSPIYKFSGLKELEVLGNDAGTHPHEYGYTGYMTNSTLDLANFINYQVGLEKLVIEGFENIEKNYDEDRYGEGITSYEGFETFYNYLPYVMLKQSFRFLQLSLCHVPLNSLKTLLFTFLNTPTSHDQTLEIKDCNLLSESANTFPDYPLIKQGRNECICGEHKSLSVQVNIPGFSPQWLFEYPNLRLKRLEMGYGLNGELDLQTLDTFPTSSIDTVCLRFSRIGYDFDTDRRAISRLLELPSIVEVEFLSCCSSSSEDGLLSCLTSIFSQQPFHLPPLRRLLIENMTLGFSIPPSHSNAQHFGLFLKALFSMPKEQLAELTLELKGSTCVYILQQEVVKSWESCCKGQKIKKLNCHFYYSNHREDMIHESLKNIAVSTDFTYIL